MDDEIIMPYDFTPRAYQEPLMKAIDGGCKRAAITWHRRGGKEKTCFNIISKEMLKRVGLYYYSFPQYKQGRKILWDGKDKTGKAFLEHIPRNLWAAKNETEMKLTLRNGSILQVVGTDRIDSIVGSNPLGIVFSEYSLQDPLAWDYMRPILAENDGLAIFNFTPRGENHAYDLYKLAKYDPKWFCQRLTVDDTEAIAAEVLAQEKREIEFKYGNDALFRQEYYCDFTVPIAGAYYAAQISQAYADGRITKVPYMPEYPVWTWWDLGISDRMCIWFGQIIGQQIRLIDYYEAFGISLAETIKKVKEKKYIYESYKHFAPHDIKVRELSYGQSRLDTADKLGIKFSVAPNLPIADGIDKVRNLFPRVWIDSEKCQQGINCLKNYRKQYDDKRKMYLDVPYHDWSSHGADAFRMMAVSLQPSDYGRPAKEQNYDYGRVNTGTGSGQTFNPETV